MKFYLTKKAQLEAQGRLQAAKPPLAKRAVEEAAPLSPSAGMGVPVSSPGGPAVAATAPRLTKGIATIGGVPRVDLLPLEVRAERRGAQNVRRAWLGVIGVAVVAGIATGAATLTSMQAKDELASTQGETSALTAQQAKYSKVRTIESKTTLIDAAREVGGSTDIDWNSYLTKLQATLPADTTIQSVSVDSATPLTPYTQSTAALQGARIGTVTVTVSSPTLPSVPKLLNGLVSLPGYVDATPGTVTAVDSAYTANIVIHINQDAFSGLYTKKGK